MVCRAKIDPRARVGNVTTGVGARVESRIVASQGRHDRVRTRARAGAGLEILDAGRHKGFDAIVEVVICDWGRGIIELKTRSATLARSKVRRGFGFVPLPTYTKV